MAPELLHKALAAHGGLDRWKRFEKVQATIVTGGQLFTMRPIRVWSPRSYGGALDLAAYPRRKSEPK